MQKIFISLLCSLILLLNLASIIFAEDNVPDNHDALSVAENSAQGNLSSTDNVLQNSFKNLLVKSSQSSSPNTSDNDKKKLQASKSRYVKIISEFDGYDYYLDTKDLRRILMPHSSSEYILDAWVKRVHTENDRDNLVSDNDTTKNYSLEHYYIRPDANQIQCLGKLNVTGHPANNINAQEYSAQCWKNLVPGSLEDEIYHSVLKVTAKLKGFELSNPKQTKKKFGLSDIVEEYLRISL